MVSATRIANSTQMPIPSNPLNPSKADIIEHFAYGGTFALSTGSRMIMVNDLFKLAWESGNRTGFMFEGSATIDGNQYSIKGYYQADKRGGWVQIIG